MLQRSLNFYHKVTQFRQYGNGYDIASIYGKAQTDGKAESDAHEPAQLFFFFFRRRRGHPPPDKEQNEVNERLEYGLERW